MKLKNLFIVLLLSATAFVTTASAQSYRSSFGLRLGYDNGLALKHFVSPTSAFDGILSFSPNHFQITGLYIYQQPMQNAPGLDWFVGGGVHLGAVYDNNYDGSKGLFGADLIGGLEYTFPVAPFSIGLDWKPTFNFTSYNSYWYAGLGLSLRYTFR